MFKQKEWWFEEEMKQTKVIYIAPAPVIRLRQLQFVTKDCCLSMLITSSDGSISWYHLLIILPLICFYLSPGMQWNCGRTFHLTTSQRYLREFWMKFTLVFSEEQKRSNSACYYICHTKQTYLKILTCVWFCGKFGDWDSFFHIEIRFKVWINLLITFW